MILHGEIDQVVEVLNDGVVRSASVKIWSSTFIRPVVKLCVLEIEQKWLKTGQWTMRGRVPLNKIRARSDTRNNWQRCRVVCTTFTTLAPRGGSSSVGWSVNSLMTRGWGSIPAQYWDTVFDPRSAKTVRSTKKSRRIKALCESGFHKSHLLK